MAAEAERSQLRNGGRSRLLAGGVAVLSIGVAVGAVATSALSRTGSVATRAATTPAITVNSSPLSTATQSTAVTVAQQLGPAVGTIVVSTAGGGALGSGFVVSNANGLSYLLTNNHVVSGATDVQVVMPSGKSYKATVVGTDTFADLAVVSVADGALPTATFGKSSDLKVGQAVVAIGSPLGNQSSVTAGVISALHRTIQAGTGGTGSSQETLADVLQTDTPISPGNSGGPLADMSGRVVGVNVAGSGSGTSIGFSIPADIADSVALQLIAHKTVVHPFAGIAFADAVQAAEGGHAFSGPGVLITTVQPGSPAALAGIQQGDILVSIGGITLDNGQTVGGLIQSHQAGDAVKVTVKRGGQSLDLNLTLGTAMAAAG